LAAVLAQRGRNVPCVWCSVGRRGAANASLVATLRRAGALAHTTVVLAAADDPPGLRVRAPFAAMSVAEAWMERGEDVLVVIDDVTQHARSHREVALLLRRPPGREAYPGDVFHLHARLLERATRRRPERGGGSVTALPILETQEQDLASYVPTNLISITDGQLLLDADLAARGAMPAIDVGRSVSRVGGRAQGPALRAVAGRLRLDVAQFEELERFARFGADLDAETEATLRRGRRVRAVLTQDALETVPEIEQLATTFAAAEGLLDDVPEDALDDVQGAIRAAVRARPGAVADRVRDGEPLGDDDREALRTQIRTAVRDALEGDDAP
jgi:F-type H+-transporting ATPase subunit alpha